MAPRTLLPVAALCSALAAGTPIAALATPAMTDSFSNANLLDANLEGTIICQRFSLEQATVSTSGCLHSVADNSIVVDIDRPNKTSGSLSGCAVCTWRSVATDADGDLCDLELRIDVAATDDSADGATLAFDSTLFEDGGGVCLGCVPSSGECTQPAISFIASLRLVKANTDAVATGEVPLLVAAGDRDEQEVQGGIQTGALRLVRGSEPGPLYINASTHSVHQILADPALLEMEWSGTGAAGIVPSTPSDADEFPKDEDGDAPANDKLLDHRESMADSASVTPDETDNAIETDGSSYSSGSNYDSAQDVEAGNCCMLVALDQTATVDAASIDAVAANEPKRKAATITFPKTVELVFMPSGEVVAPTALTLLGANAAYNDIQGLSTSNTATTAKLHLYTVAPNGARTEEFDGDRLLVQRRLDIKEDISYRMELTGFDRARDANVIAAAMEAPQRLMTLRFKFNPVIPK